MIEESSLKGFYGVAQRVFYTVPNAKDAKTETMSFQ